MTEKNSLPDQSPHIPQDPIPMQDWQVDGEDFLFNPTFTDEENTKQEDQTFASPTTSATSAKSSPSKKQESGQHNTTNFFPSQVVEESEPPPSSEQIIEVLLFVGGAPLTFDATQQVIRGMTRELFQETVRNLSKKYQAQNRPYTLQQVSGGYVVSVKPIFKHLREQLFGGPREARLTQPALDLLSLIAYRQPINKSELEAIRGNDPSSVLRQLVRLGLAAVSKQVDGETTTMVYSTTNRFLELFQLSSLDDLPRIGEAQLISH
jgi:segregation and condensation protein B